MPVSNIYKNDRLVFNLLFMLFLVNILFCALVLHLFSSVRFLFLQGLILVLLFFYVLTLRRRTDAVISGYLLFLMAFFMSLGQFYLYPSLWSYQFAYVTTFVLLFLQRRPVIWLSALNGCLLWFFAYLLWDSGYLSTAGIFAMEMGVGALLTAFIILAAWQGGLGLKRKFSEDKGKINLFETLHFVTWDYDFDSSRLQITPGIEPLSGHTAEEFVRNPQLLKKIVHPYDLIKVRAAQKELLLGKLNFIEYRVLKPNGEIKWVQNYMVALKDQNQQVNRLSGVIIDVTAQRTEQEKMNRMAFFDTLTGLPNRAMFEHYFMHFISRSEHVKQRMALMFLDLNGFKGVNDQFGHLIGDLILKEVALRLKEVLRGTDMISRLGGDEFVVLITRIDEDSLHLVADRVVRSFDRPFLVNQLKIYIGVSIGISTFPDDGKDLKTLVEKADQAMYMVKGRGRSEYQLFQSRVGV